MTDIGIVLELSQSRSAALEACEAYPDVGIEIAQVSSYEEGVAAARRMIEEGAQALVTRAGYISYLRNANLSAPVIDIPFALSNISQSCAEACRRYGCVGLVATRYVVEQVRAWDSVLGTNVKYYCVNAPSDYEAAAKQARLDGANALVGGYDETRYAEQEGMQRVIMAAGKAEFAEAISEAMKIVAQIHTETKKNEELKTLFDIIGDALLMFDSEGNVVQMNRRASMILGTASKDQIGRPLKDGELSHSVRKVLESGQDIAYDLQECNGAKYVCNIKAVRPGGRTNGAVATLQSVEYVQTMERNARTKLAERGLTAVYSFDNIIGNSKKMQEALYRAKRYSGVDSNVLITGESGTGKELFAQGIHNYSLRANGPFVAINCATLPASLLESELFGYSEGAFTGAKKGGKAGLFELAHNGTLFLDEVAEMEMPIQARLLRVIQEKRVMRIGDDKIIPVDVRIIAATNKNLKSMVGEGLFRTDLFYRLNVLELHLPAVRERGMDIRLLLEQYLMKYAAHNKRKIPDISPKAMDMLLSFPWPGNVREISNAAERLVVTSSDGRVDTEDIIELLDIDEPAERAEEKDGDNKEIIDAMAACRGNKTAAAAMLGMSRPTLYKKLKKLGIE